MPFKKQIRSKVSNINFLENKRNPSASKRIIQVYGFKTAIENNSKDPIFNKALLDAEEMQKNTQKNQNCLAKVC